MSNIVSVRYYGTRLFIKTELYRLTWLIRPYWMSRKRFKSSFGGGGWEFVKEIQKDGTGDGTIHFSDLHEIE